MSNENGFDINQIKSCVTTLLPNKVIFALGDSEEVKCASVWIKQLQDRLSEAEKVIERYSPYCVPMFVETDSKEFKELKEIWLAREYQAKWKEKPPTNQ